MHHKSKIDHADLTHQDHAYADRMALGQRLQWWRHLKGIKTTEAAAELGVSTAAWGHWETGARFPSAEMLLDLAAYTRLPLRVLLCPEMEACPFVKAGELPDPLRPCCRCNRVDETS